MIGERAERGAQRSEGLSIALAAHVANTSFDSLPATTVLAAKRALLDGIGVMLAASGICEEVQPFVRIAQGAGPGPATILGHLGGVQPAMAALANGAMGHALDFEDVLDDGPAHPNASLLPAVLALAQQEMKPISGREMIAAIAIGGDLACRMTYALTRPMEVGGWFPPPILGAFGATAASARILGLSPRGVLDAFSMLMCQNVCPGEIKNGRDTVLRAVREAFPALASVVSANLAREGVRGFDAPIEGDSGFFRMFADRHYDPDLLLRSLGEQYAIENLSFKMLPACRGTHAYIESIFALRDAHHIKTPDIAEVIAVGGPIQRMLADPIGRKRAPATSIDAKFSIPYCIGAALVLDKIDFDSFSAQHLVDPEILRSAALVRFDERSERGRDRAAAGGVIVRMRDGSVLDHHVEYPRGHASRPLEDDELIEKFVMCAGRAARPISPGEAGELAGRILSVEQAADCIAHLGWRN